MTEGFRIAAGCLQYVSFYRMGFVLKSDFFTLVNVLVDTKAAIFLFFSLFLSRFLLLYETLLKLFRSF